MPNYRLRFEEHALQLQVKKPEAVQCQIIKIWTPKPAINTQKEIDEMDYSNIKKPAEKDTRKIAIILGSIKLDTDTETIEVPEEILKVMSKDKEKAIA